MNCVTLENSPLLVELLKQGILDNMEHYNKEDLVRGLNIKQLNSYVGEAMGRLKLDITEDNIAEYANDIAATLDKLQDERVPEELKQAYSPGIENIYFGTNDNKILSNPSKRPFTINITDPEYSPIFSPFKFQSDTVQFDSVEQAFHYIKTLQYALFMANKGQLSAELWEHVSTILSTIKSPTKSLLSPAKLREITRSLRFSNNLDRMEFFDTHWSGNRVENNPRYTIMRKLIWDSLQANTDQSRVAKQALIGYKAAGKTLVHQYRGVDKDVLFTKIINDIATELYNQAPKTPGYTHREWYRELNYDSLAERTVEAKRELGVITISRRAKSVASVFRDILGNSMQDEIDELNEQLVGNISEEERTNILRHIKSLDIYSYLESLSEAEIESLFQSTKDTFVNLMYPTDGSEAATDALSLQEAKQFSLFLKNFEPVLEKAKEYIRDVMFMPLPLSSFVGFNGEEADNALYEEGEDFLDQEEAPKESYQINDLSLTTYDRHSLRMRRFISSIPEYDPSTDSIKIDEVGTVQYLDPKYISKTIQAFTKEMTHSSQLNTVLDIIVNKYPELKYLRDALVNFVDVTDPEFRVDPKLEAIRSEFFHTYLIGYNQVTIQKAEVEKGRVVHKTITVNSERTDNSNYEEWSRNHEDGRVLTSEDTSIYNKSGYNPNNAKEVLKALTDIQKDIKNMSSEELDTFIENDEELVPRIRTLLADMGISIGEYELKKSIIAGYLIDKNIENRHPLHRLLKSTISISKYVSRNKVSDGNSLFADFSTAFNTIASILDYSDRREVEASFRQDGKLISSYVKSFGLGELVKRIKARYVPDAKGLTGTQQYILKKYADDYFVTKSPAEYDTEGNITKHPVFYSEWLNLLYNGAQEDLNLSLLYTVDGEEYLDMGPDAYARALFREFFVKVNPENPRARYHIPVMSNAHSARFITFKRYIEYEDINGNTVSIQQQLRPLYRDLIKQELRRMTAVQDRAKKFKDGSLSVAVDYIKNYDLSFKNGEFIPGTGGDKFHFLAHFNNLNFTYKGKKGTFLQHYNSLVADSGFYDPTIMDEFLDSAIEAYVKSEINHNTSLFKHAFGREKGSNNLVKREELKKLFSNIGNTLNWAKAYPKVQKALDNLYLALESKQSSSLEAWNSLISEIKDIGNIQDSVKDSIIEKLGKIPIKDIKLEKDVIEYTWNSIYAESQILMLTIGDVAFFKDNTDLQKRFKQVHSPVDRLDTMATKDGIRVGTEMERSIYLMDDLLDSSGLDNIEMYLDGLVSKGNIDVGSKMYIMSKFHDINSTDAQSFRTLKGYKKLLTMAGILKPDVEISLDNIANGTATAADFNVIFQTIKPFAAGLTTVSNGLGGKMNKPFQHKNSEAILMALTAAVSDFYKDNIRLRTLAEFMDNNDIDVAHFESVVKVGGNAKIDLREETTRKYPTKEKMLGYLEGLLQKHPEYIHEIDFMDYGFQTATPEHFVDTLQLIGTQVRKIVVGDFDRMRAEGVLITIGNKSMTIDDWFRHYNALNTANIIDSFVEVDKVFSDIRQIEKVLKEEILSNPKYDKELLDAVSVDPNTGRFKIPLEDPIITLEVQALLNSVLKNRVSKQKIRGGSAILMSDYGFSDKLKIQYREDGSPAGVEVYLPAFSTEFIEPLLKKNKDGSFILDVNATIDVPVYKTEVVRTTKEYRKSSLNEDQMYTGDVTPEENTIFVFGSNTEGKHGKGSAKVAKDKFGAIHGQSRGLQGNSYALVTTDQSKGNKGISEEEIIGNIRELYELASSMPDKKFKIAYRNKGDVATLNGYSGNEMMLMFIKAGDIPSNIVFSEEWYDGMNNILASEHTIEEVEEVRKTIVGTKKERIIDSELLKAFGYRIPTENMYSTVPIIIKGFLPSQWGSAIMMPKEIISLSGADFDVDKLYILLKEFKKKQVYDEEALYKFVNSLPNSGMPMSIKSTEEYVEFLKASDNPVLEKFKIGEVFKAVQYVDSKEEMDNSRAARNNRIIDLMWNLTTHPVNGERWLKPGNFDNLKLGSRFLNIVTQANPIILANDLKVDIEDLGDKLLSMSIGELDAISTKYGIQQSPTSIATQVHYYYQNSSGDVLIGSYANHSMNHIIMQRLGTEMHEGLRVRWGEHTSTTISGEYALNGNRRISDNSASFLNASVDNAKDPVLASFRQNLAVSNITEFLIRSGFDPIDIGVFLNTPEVVRVLDLEYVNSMEREVLTYLMQAAEDKEIRIKYAEGSFIYFDTSHLNGGKALTTKDMLAMIYRYNTLGDENFGVTRDKVLLLWDMLYKAIVGGKLIGSITSNTKVDTAKMYAGPYMYITESHRNKIREMDDLLIEYPLFKKYKPFKDIEFISRDRKALFDKLNNSDFPIMQSYYSLSLMEERRLLGKYLAFYSPVVEEAKEAVEKLIGKKMDEVMLNRFYKDIILYAMSVHEVYTHADIDGKLHEDVTRRMYDILTDTPSDLEYLKQNMKGNALLDHLRVYRSNTELGIPTIEPKRTSKLSKETKDLIKYGWEELFDMGGPYMEFALNLFQYATYRNGFALGRNSFIGFAPVKVRMAFANYEETLQLLKDGIIDLSGFPIQFVRHNIGEDNFLKERKNVYKEKPDKSRVLNPDVLNLDANDLESNFFKGFLHVVVHRDENGVPYHVVEPRETMQINAYDAESKTAYQFIYLLDEAIYDEETGSISSLKYIKVDRLGVLKQFKEYKYLNSVSKDFKTGHASDFIVAKKLIKDKLEQEKARRDEIIKKAIEKLKGGKKKIEPLGSVKLEEEEVNGTEEDYAEFNNSIFLAALAGEQIESEERPKVKKSNAANNPVPTDGDLDVCPI